jgi:hypothetical protein
MGGSGAIIFLGVTAALAVVAWGAFAARRSVAVAVVAAIVAVLASGCAWYAFAESQSLPWTIGYGVVTLLSICVGIKHVVGRRTALDKIQD